MLDDARGGRDSKDRRDRDSRDREGRDGRESRDDRDESLNVVSRHGAEIVSSTIIPPTMLIKEETRRRRKHRASANLSETTEVRNDDDNRSRASGVSRPGKNKKNGERIQSFGKMMGPVKRKLPSDYHTSIVVIVTSQNQPDNLNMISSCYEGCA